MKTALILMSILIFGIDNPLPGQEKLTVDEIMDRSRDNQTLSGSEYVGTLIIMDKKGRERVRKIAAASRRYEDLNVDKRIIKFLEPADVKGTAMLIFDNDEGDDDMWIYMPSLRKTRRIVSSDKGKSFMGSEFSNADMAAENSADFTYTFLGVEETDGEPCWKVGVVPNDEEIADDNGFSRKIMWLSQNDFVARRIIFYDFYDELLKEQTNRNIILVDEDNNKYRAGEMIMVNVQNGRKSIMRMDKVVFNPNVKDEYFTTRYLEKP